MKYLLFALLLSVPAVAAEKPIALYCFTEPMSTSFMIDTVGKEVQARVMFSYGAAYAPAISGIFTPSDLPTLEKWAGYIKKMKPEMTFHWPRAKCKAEKSRFECWGSDDVQEGEGGVPFQPFALYSTNIIEDGVAGRQEFIQVTMSVFTGNDNGTVEMKFPKEGCFSGRQEAETRLGRKF